jgi:SAM-dependent methyltransferase
MAIAIFHTAARGRLRGVSSHDAEYFDGWYAAKLDADVLDDAKRHTLGHPPEFRGSSFLPLDGLHDVGEFLELGAGRRLLDLACGVGAFGCWLAQRSGCDLVGVDFSPVAVEQARQSATRAFGLPPERTDFQVGELTATGLPDASVDAVMVLDSFQFANGIDVARECARVLRPGGRIAVTGWEPVDRDDPNVSERMRACDIAGSLTAAGFTDVVREERPDWQQAERACWQEIVTHDPSEHPALASAVAEGRRSLDNRGKLRRLRVTATAPA